MPNRINDAIRGVKEVRLVGDNVEQGIYSYEAAMRMADDMNLDLVEISPNAAPPVCRILDYQKFLYQKKRKEKEIKANSAKVVIKEIRFGPQTDEHDYNFKLKHAQEFLKDGNKVKAYVFFRGRSILFKDQGELLLARFANDLEEYGKVAGPSEGPGGSYGGKNQPGAENSPHGLECPLREAGKASERCGWTACLLRPFLLCPRLRRFSVCGDGI